MYRQKTLLLALASLTLATNPVDLDLKPCGEAFFHPAKYSCFDGSFLCPVIAGVATQRCGNDCFLPSEYICSNGVLDQVKADAARYTITNLASPTSSSSPAGTSASGVPAVPGNSPPPCSPATPENVQYLSSPPYANFFLSTCHVATHVVITSPLTSSNLTIIGPRLIAAFPGGNSGTAAFWEPQHGQNGSLSIELVERDGRNLSEVYIPSNASGGISSNPAVGVSGLLHFNSSAKLTVPILGSVRTIRDFTEGPSLLVPKIQDAILFENEQSGAVIMHRLWLDNVTSTWLSFAPVSEGSSLTIDNKTVLFDEGSYLFWTAYDFPQLQQLEASQVLDSSHQQLISQQPDSTTSLSFLSYTEKLLAGTWRFLTYFGRDSMIAALLLQPVLSYGEGSAMEAVIGAVLERINRTDGSVCHEETLGDYATYLNQQMNITSNDPLYTYPMIDVDYYLPVLMQRYFLQDFDATVNGNATGSGLGRANAVLSTPAGATNPANKNLTWSDLAVQNAEKIVDIAARFASDQTKRTKENLARLKPDQIVGEWRDSTYGIGGGRIPYDVNTALMPAALYAISALSSAGVYGQKHKEWSTTAQEYAAVWEDNTLDFFRVTLPVDEARSRLEAYKQQSDFGGSDDAESVSQGDVGNVTFHAVALDGYDALEQVQVMNTDDCFRLFLLDGSNADLSSNSSRAATYQTQLTAFLNQSALNVARTFPTGLLTDVGLLVANPAYGGDPVYAANWTTSAYHGTVVWSWPMAMIAKGFEVQLLRCGNISTSDRQKSSPDFCKDQAVYDNVLTAYNKLWDVIEKNEEHLSEEVWSWQYENGEFRFVELGDLPPPPGTSPTESDIRQLWSLTFLAVTRNQELSFA